MKRTLSLVLSLIMVLGIFTSVPVTVNAAVPFTDNLTYECMYNTLFISGTGDMTNFTSSSSPWSGYEIKEVYINNGVTSIGNYAFRNCAKLEKVTIPDSVTTIGDSAFLNCKKLKSVTILGSIKSIGRCAFYDCENLSSITVPDTVTSIGANAFIGTACYNNNSNWSNGMLYIGNHLISGTGGNPSIKAGTKTIADYAFYGCTYLSSITIPSSVTNIGKSAFADCSGLKYVFYPETQEQWDSITIESNNSYLTSSAIHYETTDHTYGDYIFDYSSNTKKHECIVCGYSLTEEIVLADLLTFTLNDDGISYSITDCKESAAGEIVIPDTYNGLPITSIGSYAFSNCKNITSVTIHSNISSINDYAFYNCYKLKDFKINDLEAWCLIDFGECIINHSPWNLYLNDVLVTELVIPESITEIKDYAFDGCGNIVSVTIPEGVVRIGDGAFSNNHSLMEVSLPKGIIDIGMSAFSATGIYNNIQVRENGALYIDEYLIEVFEPSSENYVIKDGTILIGGGAFSWTFTSDIQIKSIEIPSSVKHICDNAFSHCYSLCELTIPSGVKTIGNAAFYNCTNLASIKIPDSVTSIGEFAFAECKNLTSLDIPRGIKNIGEQTFYNCTNLFSIVIPDSITTIGDYAFYCCPNLKYLFFSGSKECWNNIIKGSMNYILDDVYIHYNTTSHESSDWIIDMNPSCVDYGVKHIECSQCGLFMKEEIIPATGTHKHSDWIIDRNATCTASGSKHKECTVCGVTTETDTIPATGHKESYWIFDEYATCTTGGSKHKECTECGEILEIKTIPAEGHTTGHWIIDSQPTTNAPGQQHKECIYCGEVLETETIPQLKPATPKVATTNEINGVNITWNAVDGAVKYNVYRRQGGSSSWIYVGTTTSTSLTDTKVTSGIYYVYSVRAYNNAGQYSDFVSANTQTRKFMATPKLTTIYNHTNGLAIKWNAVSGVTKGYRVYRRGAGSTYWTYLGTTKNLYFIDNAVKNRSGEYFRYTVIADGGYHSKFDTTGLYLKRLANPTLTSAVSSSAGITVKWGTVKGTTGYYVYRKTANSSWVRIAAVGGTNNTAYLDKTARKGVTYTYTVRAVYGTTTSAYNSGISCYDKY